MNWATKTKRSGCYKVFAGEDGNILTSYTPGQYIQMNIRVTCYAMTYRGLMMYAVDSTEKKVGDWVIPVEEPDVFDTPWKSATHECHGTVMHASAEVKPYHSIFHFAAPPVGTGKITFRVLIKVIILYWDNTNQ
jgi:hypothetical protein